MALVRDFGDTLRYELEVLRKVPLRKKGLVLGEPKAPADLGVTTTKNTVLTAESEERAFMVCYDRQTLAAFFGNTFTQAGHGLTLLAKSVKTTHDLIPDINAAYSLGLTKEDVIDEPVVLKFTTTKVTIRVTPTCLWFTGSAELTLKGKYEQVGEELVIGFDASPLICKDITTGVSPTLSRAGQFVHGNDYGPATAALKAMAWGNNHTWVNGVPAQLTAMAAAMNNVDGLGWVYSTSYGVKNNLNNGNVVYNGPTEGCDVKIRADIVEPALYHYNERFPLCREDKTHVLVFQPNPSYGASNIGYYPMFVHYGENVPKEHLEQVDKAPVHWWKLEEDRLNYGSSEAKEPFPDIVNLLEDPDWGKMAGLKATGVFPLGFSWETDRDFTLSFDFARLDTGQDYQGLFGDSTGAAPVGACVMSNIGRFYFTQGTNSWNNSFSGIVYRQKCQVTVCKRGTRVLLYVDGKCVSEDTFTSAQAFMAWTHFGKVNHFLKTTSRFGNIRLFDYCLNRKQVQRLYRGLL